MTILPDVVAYDLDIVFCGTAAGETSAKCEAYYARPGNAFWPTLHKVGLTSRQFLPEEYPDLLTLGMGLTDLVKCTFGNDSALAPEGFDRNRLANLISHYHPRIVAFTSKRAGAEFAQCKVSQIDYGLLPYREGETKLFILPSPSGQARRYFNEEHWRDLARLRATVAKTRLG